MGVVQALPESSAIDAADEPQRRDTISFHVPQGVAPDGAGDRPSVLGQLPPRDTTALVRDVRDRLRLAIVLGEIQTGSRLNQVKLAQQLGVSRMPVRTAITELVTEGILEVVPGGGVIVSPLTADDVRNVFEVRGALEIRAARTVAVDQPTWGIAKIEKIVDAHRSHFHEYAPAQLLTADRDFHMAILDATGNPFFRRSIMPVWSTVERAMVQVLNLSEVFEQAWTQHDQIARAIRAGDADEVEATSREHLEFAAEALARAILVDSADPATGVT
ncbi:GntR family transcriptional regulator [Brevibacterium atlanticum]|uniref:GntR family transcriptional regulator n=1 Tax=Brevibacterium atlanticum TaxID=2697563 RepID=UPI00141DBF50|nr:GntR family transcriptional regulator [Brevibacterium atlanticum]